MADKTIYGFSIDEARRRGYTTSDNEKNTTAMLNGQLDITFGLVRFIRQVLGSDAAVQVSTAQDNDYEYTIIRISWLYYGLEHSLKISYQDFANEDVDLYKFLTEAKEEYKALFEVEHHPAAEPDSEIWQAEDHLQRAKKLKVSVIGADGRISFREDN